MSEEVKNLIKEKRYTRGTFTVREGSGEYVVQTSEQQTLLYVYEKFQDHLNRAIQGSIVLVERVNIPEMRNSRKEFVKVVRVDYPSNMKNIYGVLKYGQYGEPLFVPLDPRLPSMIVLEVSSKVPKELVFPANQPYSLIIGSKLDPQLFEGKFVKVKFLEWSAHSAYPYCKLCEVIGNMNDRE